MNFTILDDHRQTGVDERTTADGQVLVAISDIPDALGWERKPQGWCRGDICIPARVAEGSSGTAGAWTWPRSPS